MSNRARTILITMVAVVWAINFTAPVVVQGYVPPTEVHVVFMAILGTLALGYKERNDGNRPKSQGQIDKSGSKQVPGAPDEIMVPPKQQSTPDEN